MEESSGLVETRPKVFSVAGCSRLYVFTCLISFVFGFPLGEQQLTAVMALLLLWLLLMVKLTVMMMMMVLLVIIERRGG